MKKIVGTVADALIHFVIVCGIIAVPLYYVIGRGDGYFFSIYDVYKEVLTQSIALILLALYCVRTLVADEWRIKRLPVYLPLGLFFLMLCISFIPMGNYYEGFVFLKRYIAHYLTVFIVIACCDTKERIHYYLNWMIAVGLGVSAYALLQIFGYDFSFLIQNFKGNATDGNPNFTGEYMGMIFVLTVWKMFAHLGKRRSVVFLLCALVMGLFLMLNKNKGVWIALTVSTSCIAAYVAVLLRARVLDPGFSEQQRRISRICVKVVVISSLLVVGVSAVALTPLAVRLHPGLEKYNGIIRSFFLEFSQFNTAIYFFTPEAKIPEERIALGDTTMQRILIWQNSLNLIRDNPVLGTGIGNFKIDYQPYRTRKEQLATGPDVFVRHMHNDILQFWAELGPVGLLLFFSIVGTLIWMDHRIIVRSVAFPVQCLALGFIMSFITIVITAFFQFSLQTPNPAFTFWLLIALNGAFYWVVWYRDGVGLLPSRLHQAYLSRYGLSAPVPETAKLKKKKGKEALQQIAQSAGTVAVAGTLRKWLVPVLVLGVIAGCCLHGLVWMQAHAFYYRQFGQALQRMGLHEKAAIVFRKSLKFEPQSWESLFLLGNEYAAMNKFDEAKQAHEQSLRFNPYHAKGHYNYANTLHKLGDVKGAIEHYELAVKYDDMLQQAYCNLGAMYFEGKEYEKSIDCYKRSLIVDPKFFSAYYNIAYALAGLGRIGEAVPYLQKAKELQPQSEKVQKLEQQIMALISQEQARRAQQQ